MAVGEDTAFTMANGPERRLSGGPSFQKERMAVHSIQLQLLSDRKQDPIGKLASSPSTVREAANKFISSPLPSVPVG
jgi:hypothetical protein